MANPMLTRSALTPRSSAIQGMAYGLVPSLALWAAIAVAVWAA